MSKVFPQPESSVKYGNIAFRCRPGANWASTFNALMRDRQWIDAIKLHRNHTGSTLKDSKDYVDAVREGRADPPTLTMEVWCGLAGKP